MGQRLHLVRKDKYRLNIISFTDKDYESIKQHNSKYKYRFSIKEKLSEQPVDFYDSNVLDDKLGFDIKSSLQFGTYLYVIEKINLADESIDELAYGLIDIYPDIVDY
jgi:hypothetical protein